jgi:hypothetical protein
VLAERGLSEEEIRQLFEDGVVSDEHPDLHEKESVKP